jgi:hypothetical protein
MATTQALLFSFFGFLGFILVWQVIGFLKTLKADRVRFAFSVWRLINFEVETENADPSSHRTKRQALQRTSTSSGRRTHRPAKR